MTRENAKEDVVFGDTGTFYASSVLAEYEAAAAEASGPEGQRCREIVERIKQAPQVSESQLFELELAVVRLQSSERLRRRVCILREKYRALVGDAVYERYVKCAAGDPGKAGLPELRAEMETLLSEFHWHYSALKTRDAIFRRLRRNFLIVLAVFVVLVSMLVWIPVLKDTRVPALAVIILIGMLGALTSILRRMQLAQMQPMSPIDNPVAKLTELGLGTSSIYLALASGAIFPVVLVLLFASKLLEGGLFPLMDTPAKADGGLMFHVFADKTGPQSGVDFAKLLVWSFVSGFLERFVPDVLDRLVAGTSQRKTVAAPEAPGGTTRSP